jgi:peroxiredoxin Q/BCP
MLQVGDVAPDFTLTADDGSEVSLSDYRGRKVVLYFYPKADTPGCTRQACAIRDVYGEIDAGGAVVLGISADDLPTLLKFKEKYDLPFPLLSDPDHQVAEMYGAWGEKTSYGRTSEGIIRSHFAVDEDGRITDLEIKVKPESTADLALHLIDL